MKPIAHIGWKSPSNIAFIKYWGKSGEQYPQNPSLSMTLSKCVTTTRIKVFKQQSNKISIDFTFKFDGSEEPAFAGRIHKYLMAISNRISFLHKYKLEIESSNSFPHSAGIASSASAMSALALCLVSLENALGDSKPYDIFREAAVLARLASGSATRSLYGGFVNWGEIDGTSESSNEYGSPLNFEVASIFKNLNDSILIIDSGKKKVSSSVGHALMNGHPYADQRFINARNNLNELLGVLRAGDFKKFSRILEMEALSLHALMMTANPWYTLLAPNTLTAIQSIRDFREKTKTRLTFTLDAGPNVHLIYPRAEEKTVHNFIDSELRNLCAKGQVIYDGLGNGPEPVVESVIP
ncbi:MAG: hypothetical protein JXA77_10725 [Bacteroidales bacterium]|nr:hypothetical protein [Bacteroidales bacterium]MBN2818515.1 hypothetical protein [Bacteroidales bacterium]